MCEDFFWKTDWWLIEKNAGYGLLPIPCPRDAEISTLLREWMQSESIARLQAISELTFDHSIVLGGYSERMASLAVRESNDEFISLGLIALGLDDWQFDYRENLLVVCLHYDAAGRIGQSADKLFEHAACFLPQRSAKGLRAYTRRCQTDKSLEVMGYVADSDEEGFRYRRTW